MKQQADSIRQSDTGSRTVTQMLMILLCLVFLSILLVGCTAAPQVSSDLPTQSDESSTAPSIELDQYQTNPVPEGQPAPVEPQTNEVDKKTEYHCTIVISAATILDQIGSLDPAKLSVLPEDGMIVQEQTVVFYEGETVFDVLLRATKDQKIHMEFTSAPIYNSKYIEGINNLYEFDCGELSGWMYKVNGWFPNYGCSRYTLADGDQIEWLYTCDLGRDIGGDWESQYSQEQ